MTKRSQLSTIVGTHTRSIEPERCYFYIKAISKSLESELLSGLYKIPHHYRTQQTKERSKTGNIMEVQYINYSNIIRQSGFWQSCFAAFGFAPVIRPPPMMCHYYRDLLSPSGNWDINLSVPPLFDTQLGSSSALLAAKKVNDKSEADFPCVGFTKPPRIAIIGGGIAGVTAANALSKKLSSNNVAAKIVIFEGDDRGSNNRVDFSNHENPSWQAGKLGSSFLTLSIR
jgi:hypothetical protein